MIERGQRLRFALEPVESRRIAGDRGRQHLQRHLATEPEVGGAIDFAHSAGAEHGSDPVVG